MGTVQNIKNLLHISHNLYTKRSTECILSSDVEITYNDFARLWRYQHNVVCTAMPQLASVIEQSHRQILC